MKVYRYFNRWMEIRVLFWLDTHTGTMRDHIEPIEDEL